MSGDEAKAFGIVDQVIEKRPDETPAGKAAAAGGGLKRCFLARFLDFQGASGRVPKCTAGIGCPWNRMPWPWRAHVCGEEAANLGNSATGT